MEIARPVAPLSQAIIKRHAAAVPRKWAGRCVSGQSVVFRPMAIVMASSMHASDLDRAGKRASARRLSWSIAISLGVHVLAIAVLLGILQSRIVAPASHVGVPLPIDVALVAQRPIAFSAPPELPEQAAEIPPAEPLPAETPKERNPSIGAIELPSPSPAPKSPPVTSTPAPGAAVPFDPGVDRTPTDAPPPGDVSVGTLNDPSRIGGAQALRLASRFPQPVAKRPLLLDTLTVPYPPRAAMAYRDARITVLMLIDASGRITDTTLYPDDPYFTPTILAALRSSRFAPAEVEAKPVPYWAMMEFVFRMRHSARAPRPAPE